MFETELKFQIPDARLAAVQRAVATTTATTLRLRARYFDTPERHLARAAMALRLRLEGERWVQTLKGRGDGLLQRLEHEVVLDGADPSAVPALDLSRHDGTPAGTALRLALGDAASTLACRYETDVHRTLRLLRHDGARVELALDLGEIRAGDATWPLQELEFELKDGPVDGLLALAARWVERHHLWLDVRSKAERGERLASGIVLGAPVPAATLRHAEDLPLPEARRQALAATLAPLLANLADRADPRASGLAHDEQVHQARVGLRRLRGVWKLLDDGGPTPAWMAGLVEAFGHLGSDRDQVVLAAQLEEIGAAPTAPLGTAELVERLPADAADTLAPWLRSPPPQRLWLDLIGAMRATPAEAQGPGAQHGSGAGPSGQDAAAVMLLAHVRPRLERLWRQVARDARRFARLADGERHRLRKRLKRLRDGIDSLRPLLRPRATQRWLERIRPAQEALGLYNDLCVSEQLLLKVDGGGAPDPAAAAYALGWLAGRRAALLTDGERALQRLLALDDGEGLDLWPRRARRST
ncbi:CYTH and CHAD domain-containing protein [Leptothrix discophora]|uniref:CYTH and CHAD domain-containing protein n=1 Tax=Leptothrix discophora TaxID=89 RepID=A0ABT9G7B1_LEPDI|nr:CYTH and CHAD domain-containing protein [Leptothrix discophora]MDP4302369.1 CYTH and CHAD domain-containing protein [Leptothrix discophora]